VVATRAQPAFEVTAALENLRLGEVLNARDSLCPIRSVLSGARHLSSLQARYIFLPEEIGLEGSTT